jgi:hypothetical protein
VTNPHEGSAALERPSSARPAVTQRLVSWGIVLPRRTPWKELTVRQRNGMIARGAIQLGLLAAALRDLHIRPADQIRGPKPMWVAVSGVNYLGVGPIAYFLFGRRRT